MTKSFQFARTSLSILAAKLAFFEVGMHSSKHFFAGSVQFILSFGLLFAERETVFNLSRVRKTLNFLAPFFEVPYSPCCASVFYRVSQRHHFWFPLSAFELVLSSACFRFQLTYGILPVSAPSRRPVTYLAKRLIHSAGKVNKFFQLFLDCFL